MKLRDIKLQDREVQDKTEALYVKVFEKMQELISQFSPSSAIADFE